MNNQERIYKPCFYCKCPIVENDRISISSITNSGLKYYITNKYKKKLILVADVTVYEADLMHLHCYNKIESEYESI